MAALMLFARLAADPASGPILYPHGAPQAASTATAHAGTGGSTVLLVAILAAAAGAWLLWNRSRQNPRWGGPSQKLLSVAETKALGNRQYLVVAAYGKQRFLLGVCPTRIELLSPLDDNTPPAP